MFGESICGYLRFLRFAWLLLLIAAVGRLILGAVGVPYEEGNWFFSMVVLTYHLSLFYGAFAKKLKGYRLPQAMVLGALIALSAQVIILVLTVASYGLGVDTYFNHPFALTRGTEAVSFSGALPVRWGGLLANSITGGIGGLLGWLAGGLIPDAVGGRASD